MLKAIILAFVVLLGLSNALVVDKDIYDAFAKGNNVNMLVHLPPYEYKENTFERVRNRPLARTLVRAARVAHNDKYQPKIVALLTDLGYEIKTFWIGNTILVKNVQPSLLQTLKAFPEVVELELEKDVFHVITPMVHDVFNVETYETQWNINIVNGPQAWNYTQGAGVTVANVDTGVLYTHESLIANYRGNNDGVFSHDFNWFDPRGIQRVPYDNNGHGTHTMGTLAGSESSGIGVAPGSRWIAAKGCASSSCANTDLIASMQWTLCPTTQDGSEEDCTQGADLVSNSWGGGRGSTTFVTYIQAWVDAGIVPIFSQGNAGSSCSTANSPGDLGIVIGVGSTDSNDALSTFSSRGPGIGSAQFPLQKPEISAPGEAVRSAYPTSNTAYASLSGTSMACPNVAGVTALLLSHKPTLSIEDVRSILLETANSADLSPPKGGLATCSGVSWEAVPNYHYGYGRVDALAAIEVAKKY